VFGSNGTTSPSTPSQSQSAAPPPRSSVHSTSPSATPATRPPSTAAQVGPAGGPVPSGFHAIDLTWISAREGWSLGTAPCSSAPCTSVVRTRDGGKTWAGVPAPLAELDQGTGCSGTCVRQLRFATPLIGYAFGTNALFMTTDGGKTWARQSGGADGLEIADATVLRVSGQQPGCVPGCQYRLQRAALGSSSWSSVPLPAVTAAGDGVTLVRTGQLAAIEVYSNPAGGSNNAKSDLLTSTDGGASWASRGEACPQTGTGPAGNEVDSTALASAPDGSLSVLCVPRGSTEAAFTATSTNSGAGFSAAAPALGRPARALAAASSQVLVVVSDALYRSADGGRHWQRVLVDASITAQRSGQTFVGFESSSVGRYLIADGKSVYTTTDGGAHWSASQFN
jgi:photosystem II stability/assembly factor-like uncharacterized protein